MFEARTASVSIGKLAKLLEVRRVVVSPHLDDAVLSAWSALSEGGAHVAVVTVFAGVPPRDTPLSAWDRHTAAEGAAELVLRRREEDASALGVCEVGHIHLDFLDVVYRSAAVPRAAIVAALRDVVAEADEVWVPGGVGGHPDHLATARAALDAVGAGTVRMYADLPYAFRDWALALETVGEDASPRWLDAVLQTAPLAPQSCHEAFI